MTKVEFAKGKIVELDYSTLVLTICVGGVSIALTWDEFKELNYEVEKDFDR